MYVSTHTYFLITKMVASSYGQYSFLCMSDMLVWYRGGEGLV